jgi:hypothetical protein
MLYGETPYGSRESTPATRNGVYFHNAIDTGDIRRLNPGQSWAIPSRDGQHLAIMDQSMNANFWMLDDF